MGIQMYIEFDTPFFFDITIWFFNVLGINHRYTDIEIEISDNEDP